MLSSLTSSPTSTMGKRSILNNNTKVNYPKSSPEDSCYVCDLKSSSPSIGQHSPYHKLVENMVWSFYINDFLLCDLNLWFQMIGGKTSLPNATSPSDHDSGKGSSDTKEDDDDINKRFFSDAKLPGANVLTVKDTTQSLGPKCSQACREFGHSDTCWMPSCKYTLINSNLLLR